MFILKFIGAFGAVLALAAPLFIVFSNTIWVIFSITKKDFSGLSVLIVVAFIGFIIAGLGIIKSLGISGFPTDSIGSSKTRAVIAFLLGALMMSFAIYSYSGFDAFVFPLSATLGLITSGILFLEQYS